MRNYILIALSVFLCFSITSAANAPLKGYDRVTSKTEIASLDTVINNGFLAALQLAAIDEVVAEYADVRYHIDQVKYVSKQVRDVDNVVSYFVMVTIYDSEDLNASGTLGYVVDRENGNDKLTLRAYKIAFN